MRELRADVIVVMYSVGILNSQKLRPAAFPTASNCFYDGIYARNLLIVIQFH